MIRKIRMWLMAARIAHKSILIRQNSRKMDAWIRLRRPYSSPQLVRLACTTEELRLSLSNLVCNFAQLKNAV